MAGKKKERKENKVNGNDAQKGKVERRGNDEKSEIRERKCCEREESELQENISEPLKTRCGICNYQHKLYVHFHQQELKEDKRVVCPTRNILFF